MSTPSLPLVVGITGASGAPYAVRLLEVLAAAECEVHLSISDSGREVIYQELGIRLSLDDFSISDLLPKLDEASSGITYYNHRTFLAPIASGSFLTRGMVICPCSGSTLSAVVTASGANLIQRAADVHLKERRKLVLVPRETPLSTVQLENYYRASQFGATLLPAMPGFYHQPAGMDDLVDFIVARILDQFQIEHQLMKRWNEGN